MANIHEEKERMLNELFNKKRNYSSVLSSSDAILKNTEDELNALLNQNKKEIEELTKTFNYSDSDLDRLKSDIEKDFGVKLNDTPKTVVTGKASKEVFDAVLDDLKKVIIGQDIACKDLCTAFRRPYVIGSDPNKLRNALIVYGSNGTGRHEMITSLAKILKTHGLTTSSDVSYIDMARYQSSTQEILFLQDIYASLSKADPIIIIENFESASPVYNRMLADLVLNGQIVLSKRYTLNNNQLIEASSKLSGDVIDNINGNNKTLVFISEKAPSKMMDFFGKSFVEAITDKIKTEKFDEDALVLIIDKAVGQLKLKCNTQLELNIETDPSLNDLLRLSYEPSDGMDSLTPVIDKIYASLVDLVLNNDSVSDLKLVYEDVLKARYNDQELVIALGSDSDKEKEEIKKELDEIVGLDSVKEYLLSLENLLKINQLRKQKGLKTNEISKHMIFTGNPGTGKTTIARLVSRMMKACGVLKQGQLVEVTRADLVGKYVGHTAPLTMSVINSALGGVLFIDEAYALYRGKDDSFGLEAIDTLVKAMEDHRDDLIVILAGYTKEMNDFLTANSGLKSRFSNIVEFKDYSGNEMMRIAKSIAKSKDYVIADEALSALEDYFTKIQAKNDPNTGNGRLVRNRVEEAILKQSKRVLLDEKANMDRLELEDFNLN